MKIKHYFLLLCLALSSLNLEASVKLWEDFDLFSKENLNIPKKLLSTWAAFINLVGGFRFYDCRSRVAND